MAFLNRTDAGRQLACALAPRDLHDAIIMGLVHGGVPVAAEIARELDATLEICVVDKLTTRAGVTIGCLAEAGGLYVEWPRVEQLAITAEDIADSVRRCTEHLARRATLYRDHAPEPVAGRTVILVDDGVVTGSASKAALHSLWRRHAASVELAVPVADERVLSEIRPLFDRVLALESDTPLSAVGARYSDFSVVSDAEVIDLLEASRSPVRASLRSEARTRA